MNRKKVKERVGLTALNIFFILLCFVTLIPILYALSVSFNGQNSLLSSDFSFIPKQFTLDNYRQYDIVGSIHRGVVFDGGYSGGLLLFPAAVSRTAGYS